MTQEEIDKKTETVDLELQGHVYMVQKDKDGNELSRNELDGELVLKALLSVFSDAVKAYVNLNDTLAGEEEINT